MKRPPERLTQTMYNWLFDISVGRDPYQRSLGFRAKSPDRVNNRTIAALKVRGYLDEAGAITDAGTKRLNTPDAGKNS